MKIHKEGTATILVVFFMLTLINTSVWYFLRMYPFICIPFSFISLVFFLFIISFFRNPSRPVAENNNNIICPCDGKVVVIEETEEPEYFKDRRLQISIFMSPANVHVNRYPLSGIVSYFKYHRGKYLLAYHPKSSTENERTSIVLRCDDGNEILVRQIAGRLARRIVPYAREGAKVKQGDELGFIKFGSRVDLLLPPGIQVDVQMNQTVRGNVTVIAHFNQ